MLLQPTTLTETVPNTEKENALRKGRMRRPQSHLIEARIQAVRVAFRQYRLAIIFSSVVNRPPQKRTFLVPIGLFNLSSRERKAEKAFIH